MKTRLLSILLSVIVLTGAVFAPMPALAAPIEPGEAEIVSGIVLPLRPNLVPVKTTANFCRIVTIWPNRYLLVTVENTGPGPAARSFTRLSWAAGGATAMTPPLLRGASYTMRFLVPFAAFTPDWHFTIRADATNLVREWNELDNLAYGTCLG